MKEIAAILAGTTLIVGAGVVADNRPQKSDEELLVEMIEASQEGALNRTGKYSRLIKQEDSRSGLSYSVDEVVVWDNKETPSHVGYRIRLEKPDKSSKVIIRGLEEPGHDWVKPPEPLATTTQHETTRP